jgi:hypothetical protein
VINCNPTWFFVTHGKIPAKNLPTRTNLLLMKLIIKLVLAVLCAVFLGSCAAALNTAPNGHASASVGGGGYSVPGVALATGTGHYVRSPFLSSLGRQRTQGYPCGTPACVPGRTACRPPSGYRGGPPPRGHPQSRGYRGPPQGRGDPRWIDKLRAEAGRGTGGRGLLGGFSNAVNYGY